MKDHPDQYLGEGCVDCEGTPIREGDEVYFLGTLYPICRAKFVNWHGKTLSRLEISGAGYWLTAYSASMCRVRARTMQQRLERQGRIFNHSGKTNFEHGAAAPETADIVSRTGVGHATRRDDGEIPIPQDSRERTDRPMLSNPNIQQSNNPQLP